MQPTDLADQPAPDEPEAPDTPSEATPPSPAPSDAPSPSPAPGAPSPAAEAVAEPEAPGTGTSDMSAEEGEPVTAPKEPGRVRRLLRSPWTARGLNLVACGIVFVALLYPNVLRRLTLGNFARVPIEAAVIVLLMIVLPRRPRIAVTSAVGVLLGWLMIEKSLDMGWFQTLGRPFDIVLDWELLDDTYHFIQDSYGQAGAYGAAAGSLLLAAGVIALLIWALLRIGALVERHRRVSALTASGIATAWMLTMALGVQLLPNLPVAARSSATYAWDRARQARAGIANEAAFAGEVTVDAFRDTPPDQLLTALKGKDLVVTFVESYGRTVVEDPSLAAGTTAVLTDGDAKLKAAGFAARSGWLTSPTFGGNSWLAHSTLLSGLWINNQSRYRNLTASDRLTVTSAMKKAGWDTVSVMPGATKAWPEGKFYGYNRVWDSRNLGYQGPKFSWAQMPDQYTLKRFGELEYTKPGRAPLMVEMPLISSHTPWAPIPTFMDWEQVGDGSIYNTTITEGSAKADIWTSTDRVRREYGRSIRYTLTTLISWIEKYGDDNLVMVFLGDHQPSTVVTGDNASRDVPITIVAKDPAVLDRITKWNWTEGLKPAPDAPVWPMNAFRDNFLTAYGPAGDKH